MLWFSVFEAIVVRELLRFRYQTSRLVSAIVRPTLWLVAFSAGFQNVLGISITPPYQKYITYDVYMVPGLLAMVLLFQGMQSSLSLVFDREAGILRLLLTAPVPRWFVLFSKLVASAVLGVIQAYVFLAIAALLRVDMPPWAALTLTPALFLASFTLASVGLLLTVYVRRMENFAGTMNFVIFPAFFFSTALYPAWKVEESGVTWILWLITLNPFTAIVELLRFAAYNQFNMAAFAVTAGVGIVSFALAARGYDPQKGLLGRKARDDV
ncbi:ABC transporter permease [Beijerinckia sp. L45]|uniref:ABC transporter permease n=1 Tax=Beijerinckia sp. L45 TaxID=1641855 RepID=UPI00131D637B|nr:ABC transporter permease [Beijerinckia sp. L45]